MTDSVDTVTVSGDDAATYLQGQLSQDVAGMPVDGEAWTFVLAPTGKIDAFARVVRAATDRFDLLVDAGFGAQLEARLRRFLLRTKATIALSAASSEESEGGERERIAAGRLSMRDVDDRTVPAETGWVKASVSFTKGCYTGQELVARMDSRVAEPPRRLVRLSATSRIEPGDVITVAGVVVGAVTSVAASAGGCIALGYVKRGTPLTGEADVGAVVATLQGPAGADD